MPNPLPPTALSATYTTDPLDRNHRLVRLAWTAPDPATTVVSYNVYRNDSLIGSVPIAPNPLSFEDGTPGGDVDFFTYYATSVDNTLPTALESVPSDSITNMSQIVENYIRFLRSSLKDSPPDPRVQRWTDCDLLLALKQATSRINAIPMNTSFNLDTFPPDFFHFIIVAARIAALRSQAALEAAKEFTMGVGSLSITMSRTGIYNNLLSTEEAAWQTEVKAVKLNCTMRFVHGEGILTSPLPFRIRVYAPRQYRIR